MEVKIENWGLGICLLLIMFYGEPDLCDALIEFLTRGEYNGN